MLSEKTNKKVSKKRKSAWRKNISVQDVDDFLEEKRQEERIGPIDDKAFKICREPEVMSRKEKALLPMKHLAALKSSSAVPDPVGSRSRRKTKEERMHPIRRKALEARRAQGILPKKALDAQKDRRQTINMKKKKAKDALKLKDAWVDEEPKPPPNGADFQWLTKDTIRHNLTNTGQLKVAIPKSVREKTSILPSIEAPHPGLSYNPSYKDHQTLMEEVVEKERAKLREEAHLRRVTTQTFTKLTPQEHEVLWIEEMSEGLFKREGDPKEDLEESGEYKAINPPTSFDKRKTKKQKRKQKEEKTAALQRKAAKVEKKKVTDIYRLRFLNKQLGERDVRLGRRKEVKVEKTKQKAFEPKRLSATQFTAPDADFLRSCELRGSLRSSKPSGNLLADRFFSFQKRNILAPTVKRTKFDRPKRKRFVKPDFREEDEGLSVRNKRNKMIKIKREVSS